MNYESEILYTGLKYLYVQLYNRYDGVRTMLQVSQQSKTKKIVWFYENNILKSLVTGAKMIDVCVQELYEIVHCISRHKYFNVKTLVTGAGTS